MPLTDIQCKNAKPKDRSYKIFDGGGLYLEVLPTGKRLWRLKYYYLKKEKRISFGAYPLVSLLEAREEREKAKKLLLHHMDPSTHRRNKKSEISKNAQNTFKVTALEWYEMNTDRWSEGYAQKIMRILEIYIFPDLGTQPIKEITPPGLLDVLKKIEKRGNLETAHKARQYCGMIFRYGIQTGKCERDAAADLKGAIKTRQANHFKAFNIKTLPQFIQALERNESRIYERTRRAVWLSLYTFQRPGEIRQAQWSEIDWDAAEWHIAAEKMKMRRDHIVPLSDQAISILREQQKEVGKINTDWVFPSQIKPRNAMSDGTVNKAIKRLGFGDMAVAHGFRALARTTIRERLHYDSEIIEKQLAHKTNNPLGEAYDRTQFLDKRKVMMQEWADYIDTLSKYGEVVKARFG